MCECNQFTHRVTSITAGTDNVVLTVTDNTNIGNGEPFVMLISRRKSMTIPAAPLPVVVTLNGVSVPVLDSNAQQVQSNNIPLKSFGTVITTSNSTTTVAPYLIIQKIPCCNK